MLTHRRLHRDAGRAFRPAHGPRDPLPRLLPQRNRDPRRVRTPTFLHVQSSDVMCDGMLVEPQDCCTLYEPECRRPSLVVFVLTFRSRRADPPDGI